MNKKIRLEWIDVLRALAILLVVYGHRITYLKNDVDGFWFYEAYSVFLNPIKMPLFFALSGYLFRIRQGGDIAFFKKTFINTDCCNSVHLVHLTFCYVLLKEV